MAELGLSLNTFVDLFWKISIACHGQGDLWSPIDSQSKGNSVMLWPCKPKAAFSTPAPTTQQEYACISSDHCGD